MKYQITDATVSLGGETVLSHIEFEIKEGEKIALVGRNGAGKSTLLRLIAGELEPDRDDKRLLPAVSSSRRLTVELLRQTQAPSEDRTVEEELLAGCPAAGAWDQERFAYETEYNTLFTGLGFSGSDKKRLLSSFSGGEQTKIRLIRLLLAKPDILLLDEPTNHLDLNTAAWLERYLKNYKKAVIVVSHDRFFLDQVAEVTYELEQGRLTRYAGNYTAYREQKLRRYAAQKKAYERQQAERERLQHMVDRFKHKPSKAAFARSKKKAMERLEQVERPAEDMAHIFTGELTPLLPGSKWVLEAEHLKIGYDHPLLELSLRIRRGQKVGILGENGSGKSTLLKTAAGLLKPVGGKCVLGKQITIGYFDQLSANLSSEKTVAEHFGERFPALTQKELCSVLGAYLFRGREAFRRVKDLSGGEKARLVLAELLESRPNFLILDEPTNHMDIQAKETLESALRAYTGTLLVVSHDRYLLRQTAESLLILEHGSALYYPFGYEHYQERKARGQEGMGLLARVQAEEQALIAGLKAVPKAERRWVHEPPDDEAYAWWRLRQAAQAMEEADGQMRQAEERLEEARERELRGWAEAGGAEDQEMEELQRIRSQWQECWRRWHESCLAWYEALPSLPEQGAGGGQEDL